MDRFDNDPPPRYVPKPSDWNEFGYIPFYDKVNKRAFQYKKDSPEYYEAIKDGLEMMNKEEWYKYMEKDRAKRNGEKYNPNSPIPKEYQNPKKEKTNYEKDLDKRVEDAKRYAAIYNTVGNAFSTAGTFIKGPVGAYLLGAGAYMDAIQAKEGYDDYKFDKQNNKEYYSPYDYFTNTEEGIRDAISLGLDGSIGLMKVPKFNLHKGIGNTRTKAKIHNAISRVYDAAGVVNDIQDTYHSFQYKNGGKLKRFNPFNINTRL